MQKFSRSRTVLFVLLWISFVSSAFSFLPTKKDASVLSKKKETKAEELQRRKEIAEGYLNTFDQVKEPWIDPHQMVSCQSIECMDIVKKKEGINVINSQINTDSEEISSDATKDIDNILSKNIVGHQRLPNKPVLDSAQSPLLTTSTLTGRFFSRWVKKLVLLVEKENVDESSFISFSLNEDVLDYLKELSNDESLEMVQVDDLFTNLLSNAIVSKKKIYDWTDILDYTKYIVWVIAAGSFMLFIMYLFYVSSLNHPYLTSCFIFLALAVFWHWMHLFQQRVAFKQAELSSINIPNECRKHDFGFFEHIQEYLKSFFKSNGCVKYHEALSVDPFWEVSITVAISEAFAAFILQPLSTGSHILNKSLKHLFDELTVEIKIFLITFILLMLVMKCNYRIKLPCFMGVIEPCHSIGSRVQNIQPVESLSESPKEKVGKVLNIVQGDDKKTIKGADYVSPQSDNVVNRHVQQLSERVQIIDGPSECHTCGCYSKPTKIGTTHKTESVTETINENETSIPRNFPIKSDNICLDQLVDSSTKISCSPLECVNSETRSLSCHNATTKCIDSMVIPKEGMAKHFLS